MKSQPTKGKEEQHFPNKGPTPEVDLAMASQLLRSISWQSLSTCRQFPSPCLSQLAPLDRAPGEAGYPWILQEFDRNCLDWSFDDQKIKPTTGQQFETSNQKVSVVVSRSSNEISKRIPCTQQAWIFSCGLCSICVLFKGR